MAPPGKAATKEMVLATIIGLMAGAVLVYVLLTRLLLWATARWSASIARLVGVHVIAALLYTVAAGLGAAGGGEPKFLRSLLVVLPSFALVLAYDLMRRSKKVRSSAMAIDKESF